MYEIHQVLFYTLYFPYSISCKMTMMMILFLQVFWPVQNVESQMGNSYDPLLPYFSCSLTSFPMAPSLSFGWDPHSRIPKYIIAIKIFSVTTTPNLNTNPSNLILYCLFIHNVYAIFPIILLFCSYTTIFYHNPQDLTA